MFGLQSGVPQGSVLSPTLYTIYTSDYPGSAAGTNILYADDVSQVVFHPGRSGARLNARTEREITRVNDFEKRWKIKTNLAKFTVIPMSAHRPVPLHVQGVPVAFKRQGSILGLRVTGRGYTTHITARVAQARSALASLYRFRDLEEGIKLHLVKALVEENSYFPSFSIRLIINSQLSTQYPSSFFFFRTVMYQTLKCMRKLNDLTRNMCFEFFFSMLGTKTINNKELTLYGNPKKKLLKTCLLSVLRRKTLKRMQTNQYQEIEKRY